MIKKQILFFTLLLLTGCATQETTLLEEITLPPIEGEILEIEEQEIEEITTSPYYNFTEGTSQKILGKTITVAKIYTSPEIDITVDEINTKIKETKSEEIIKDLRISIQLINDIYLEEKYVTLKIEELELGENEYILRKNEQITIENKEIHLEESKTNGIIQVSVFDKGTPIGETENIKRGETKEIYGLTIINLKNYYKVEQYAWIIVN